MLLVKAPAATLVAGALLRGAALNSKTAWHLAYHGLESLDGLIVNEKTVQ
jgi:hypothetical protein